MSNTNPLFGKNNPLSNVVKVDAKVNKQIEDAQKNEEMDCICFGLELSDGKLVKVYIKADEADDFEAMLPELIGKYDDVEEALDSIADEITIVDVKIMQLTDLDDDDSVEVDPALAGTAFGNSKIVKTLNALNQQRVQESEDDAAIPLDTDHSEYSELIVKLLDLFDIQLTTELFHTSVRLVHREFVKNLTGEDKQLLQRFYEKVGEVAPTLTKKDEPVTEAAVKTNAELMKQHYDELQNVDDGTEDESERPVDAPPEDDESEDTHSNMPDADFEDRLKLTVERNVFRMIRFLVTGQRTADGDGLLVYIKPSKTNVLLNIVKNSPFHEVMLRQLLRAYLFSFDIKNHAEDRLAEAQKVDGSKKDEKSDEPDFNDMMKSDQHVKAAVAILRKMGFTDSVFEIAQIRRELSRNVRNTMRKMSTSDDRPNLRNFLRSTVKEGVEDDEEPIADDAGNKSEIDLEKLESDKDYRKEVIGSLNYAPWGFSKTDQTFKLENGKMSISLDASGEDTIQNLKKHRAAVLAKSVDGHTYTFVKRKDIGYVVKLKGAADSDAWFFPFVEVDAKLND